MADELLMERDGDITTLTINRPDDGNKVSDPMAVELAGLLAEAGSSSRCVILRGAGDTFCEGRAQMGRRGGTGLPEALDLRDNNEVVFNAYGSFRNSPAPVVAVVQGDALGFGCALASVCDVTIASDNARFQLPEMGHNIMPTMAMSSLMDRVGRKAAMYITWSTAMLSAERALTAGIVSAIVPKAELEDEVGRFVAALKKAPLPAVLAVKEYATSALTMDTRAANDFARNLHAVVNSSSRMKG